MSVSSPHLQDPPPKATRPAAPVTSVRVSAFTVPTEQPESDGTITWEATTLVLVEVTGGGETGLGYTYAAPAAARLVTDTLAGAVLGRDALDTGGAWQALVWSVRNIGRPGIASMAISAVDTALWDLKARLAGQPLFKLLGAVRESVMAYGSGGFTAFSIEEVCDQLGGWADDGFAAVKMKVGRDPDADRARVRAAREAIGDDVDLFVDANGAYGRKQALAFAEAYADLGVTWFEEPVWHTDLDGLRLCRGHFPAGMDVTMGEYGFEALDFRRLLEAGAVDVLQADATRCGGATGFLQADALCEAFEVPLSSHCGPSLHAHLGCAAKRFVHVEYFSDHARIEHLLFDGTLTPQGGRLTPDPARPGWGLDFKRADAERFVVYDGTTNTPSV